MKDKIYHWIAHKLPHRLKKWCAVEVIVHATSGKYSSQVITELTAMDALKRWEDP